MNRNYRLLTVAMILSLLFTMVLAACGNENSSNTGNDQSSDKTGESAKRITLEVMKEGAGAMLPSDKDNFVKTGLDDALNIDLKMSLTNSYH